MIEEIYDRDYQAARTELNAAIAAAVARAARAAWTAFTVLNRIEYSAPWNRPVTKAGCN